MNKWQLYVEWEKATLDLGAALIEMLRNAYEGNQPLQQRWKAALEERTEKEKWADLAIDAAGTPSDLGPISKEGLLASIKLNAVYASAQRFADACIRHLSQRLLLDPALVNRDSYQLAADIIINREAFDALHERFDARADRFLKGDYSLL